VWLNVPEMNFECRSKEFYRIFEKIERHAAKTPVPRVAPSIKSLNIQYSFDTIQSLILTFVAHILNFDSISDQQGLTTNC
jgi:hypothetical protein